MWEGGRGTSKSFTSHREQGGDVFLIVAAHLGQMTRKHKSLPFPPFMGQRRPSCTNGGNFTASKQNQSNAEHADICLSASHTGTHIKDCTPKYLRPKASRESGNATVRRDLRSKLVMERQQIVQQDHLTLRKGKKSPGW